MVASLQQLHRVKEKFANLKEQLLGSLWFVPSLMVSATIVGAFGLLQIDRQFGSKVPDILYGGGAEGARQLLSTIAGSMITVAGVVFSVTVVALSLASQQFGPRMLRNFMRDTGNQFVLGTFIATFIFCLLVLRSVRGDEYGGFTPHVSVTVAVAAAVFSLIILIYFIHHVSSSIQADLVVATIAEELDRSIERTRGLNIFPPDDAPESERYFVIAATTCGFVRAVREHALAKLAAANDTMIEVLVPRGFFIMQGSPIARATRPVDEKEVLSSISLGRSRSAAEDLSFPIDQLVELAVRSLSPSVNDPMTAIACIDRLGAAFAMLATIDLGDEGVEHEGKMRVRVRGRSFESMLVNTYRPIRMNARGMVSVHVRLIETLTEVRLRAEGSRKQAVADCIQAIREEAALATMRPEDLRAVLGAEADARRDVGGPRSAFRSLC